VTGGWPVAVGWAVAGGWAATSGWALRGGWGPATGWAVAGAGCLLAAAALTAWPGPRGRSRTRARRMLRAAAPGASVGTTGRIASVGTTRLGASVGAADPRASMGTAGPGTSVGAAGFAASVGAAGQGASPGAVRPDRWWSPGWLRPPRGSAAGSWSPDAWWPTTVAGRSRRAITLLCAGVLAGAPGFVAGGPVAAFVAAGYGALVVRAGLRRRVAGRLVAGRRQRLDALCALAADLRAGQPVPAALAGPSTSVVGTAGSAVTGALDARPGSDRIDELARAAVRLAERTGAPLADLLERIEADGRTTDRGLAAATAQAAGARATAWLLAGLPLGGIALGYGIGVDPMRVLLHTPIGAACAASAVALQIAGLAWADRLAAAPARQS
jgi:tight adherence protein B